MGRWSYSTRWETNSFLQFSVSWLKKEGYIKPVAYKYLNAGSISWIINHTGREFIVDFVIHLDVHNHSYLTLEYQQEETQGILQGLEQKYHQKVYLSTTQCNYGNSRYWFLCPTSGCEKRVGILYVHKKTFACRHCYNLVYQSQQKNYRSKLYQVFLTWERGQKIDELNRDIKTRYYAGKPTRKQKRIDKLETLY